MGQVGTGEQNGSREQRILAHEILHRNARFVAHTLATRTF